MGSCLPIQYSNDKSFALEKKEIKFLLVSFQIYNTENTNIAKNKLPTGKVSATFPSTYKAGNERNIRIVEATCAI